MSRLIILTVVGAALVAVPTALASSLPVKILMFVLIDGWNLVVRSLMSSFH